MTAAVVSVVAGLVLIALAVGADLHHRPGERVPYIGSLERRTGSRRKPVWWVIVIGVLGFALAMWGGVRIGNRLGTDWEFLFLFIGVFAPRMILVTIHNKALPPRTALRSPEDAVQP